MKKQYLTAMTLLFLAHGRGQAQAVAERQDSLTRRTFALEEVVVTGARSETDVRHLSQTVSVIGRETIEGARQSSLLPVLTEEVPGLFTTSRGILGYGVSGGAAGNISLRGLSGSSGQLMVLVDGHPQYMGLMGHPIADAYSSYLAERVEVLHGPASVLYGSNAMGGVVNIVTRRPQTDGRQTRLHTGYGSYNTLETELTHSFRQGKLSATAGASYDRTDGHRTDLDFEQYGGFLRLSYDLHRHWRAEADAHVTHFNASQPGSTSVPLLDADQRVTRGRMSVTASNRYAATAGAISFFYNWGDHWINDGYTPDPTDKNDPKAYRFDSHDDLLGVSLYQSVQLFAGNRVTVGADYFHVGGKAWNRYVEGARDGESDLLADKAADEVAAYADLRQDVGSRLTLNAGLRMDHHSSAGTEWIPQAGLALHLPQDLELKAAAGKGFRYPTLREMYMFPPQNPDLQPESLWNYELALSQRPAGGAWSWGLNLFYLEADNLIRTVPREGTTPLNQNTGKVYNAGAEAKAVWRMDRHWSARANYSFLHTSRPLLAAPRHKGYVGLVYADRRWNASTGLHYVGRLYTATAPATTEDFVLWHLRLSCQVSRHLQLWAKGENLLAKRYEINAGYPMPRATVLGGVNLSF